MACVDDELRLVNSRITGIGFEGGDEGRRRIRKLAIPNDSSVLASSNTPTTVNLAVGPICGTKTLATLI